MKNSWYNLIMDLSAINGCENFLIEKGEECSVKVPYFEFTKSVNKAKYLTIVEDGKLVIKSEAKCDNFNDPDSKLSNNSAPVLLTRLNNNKPFTLTARVTPTFLETYDAGAMYVYFNEKYWLKLAFERDERARTRIVSVRTIATSDDNNHDIVDTTSVYMKISSDIRTIGYYYSVDKKNWQLVRLYRNNYPKEIWVGVSAQSPLGKGTNATFEEFSLTENSIKDFRLGI